MKTLENSEELVTANGGKHIILHIGLHKTGSTFLQRRVFANLKESEINYNPARLTDVLRDALLLQDKGILTASKRQRLIQFVHSEVNASPQKIMFLSSELMSQSMYFLNSDERAALLAECFPGAIILLFLRNQVDWVRSAYLQALHEGYICEFDEFVGEKRLPERWDTAAMFKSLDLGKLDYREIIKSFSDEFSKDNLKVYYFEELRSVPDKLIGKIMRDIGTQASKITPSKGEDNKAYSESSVIIVKKSYRLMSKVGLRFLFEVSDRIIKWLIEKASKETFPDDIEGVGPMTLVMAPFDNLIASHDIRKIMAAGVQKVFFRIRFVNVPRFLLQRLFNRLPGMRESWRIPVERKMELEQFFRELNTELKREHPDLHIPDEYFY